VKAAMELKITGIEDGYTAEVSTFRQVADWFLQLYYHGCMCSLLNEGMQRILMFIIVLLPFIRLCW
jgi:hypothetical protein